MVQVAVRPIQLFEIVHPATSKDVIHNTLFGEAGTQTQHKKHQKFINMIRRVLGIKKIPKYKKEEIVPIYKTNLEIMGVGCKADKYDSDGNELL